MSRKSHKYHYLYKTTNLINGKFYIGVHSTSNLDDGYLGSGLILRRAIRKYGKENFKREILEFFESKEILFEKEKEYVDINCVQDKLCMNLKLGGDGGFLYEEQLLGLEKIKWLRENDPVWKSNKNKKIISHPNRVTTKNLHAAGNPKGFKDRTHSDEYKKMIGEVNSIKQSGSGNSQFGTCWITNSIENKKIKIDDLLKWTSQGWKRGRII